jgi:hypothetical protein
LEKEPGSPLFPASIGKIGKLSRRPLVRTDAADMLKRRLKQAGLPAHYSPHSFRATGITNFLENDGTLEAAQRIAGHADNRTTKLYDRRGQKVLFGGYGADSVLTRFCFNGSHAVKMVVFGKDRYGERSLVCRPNDVNPERASPKCVAECWFPGFG